MAKGKKHMGVYKVAGKSGVSYGIDYIHPQTLQRVRKILKNVTSEAAAVEIRAIEIADAARGAINKAYGLKAQGRPVLFTDMVDAYEKWAGENLKSWQTVQHRAKPLRKAFEGKFLSDLNPFMAEKYKIARAKEVSKKTVNKELSLASRVIEKAIEWKRWEGGNPFRKSRFKTPKGKKPGALTPQQVEAIMQAIEHPVKRDMVAFAYYQGWRIGEIRKLRWDDVEPEKGRAWVVDPKNSETAEVPLDPDAWEIIRKQERRSDFVFCHKNGSPFKSNLTRVIKNAAERAKVWLPPRKAWHIFRRTWASNFLQAGGDVESLRVQGGWKDHSMPLWYAEAAGEEQRKGILSRMPRLKVNGRNLPEMEKVVNLTDRIP